MGVDATAEHAREDRAAHSEPEGSRQHMTFTAIVVSHANEPGLRTMLGNLRYQTRPADEVIVYACCVSLMRLREEFPEARFFETDHRGDWGHADRAAGLVAAAGDYVGFFNSDDSYNLGFVDVMMCEAEERHADVVFCGWNTYPDCEFRLGSSTSGNFIVSRDLALTVGYPDTAVYENDGHFIDAVAAAAENIVRASVPGILYHHNKQ